MSPARFARYTLMLVAVMLLSIVLLKPALSEAALGIGTPAPAFRTQAALGGRVFTLDLGRQLRKGPVVLYFFPKAFTKGCTLEAGAFAESHDQFAAAGATVIGMSTDRITDLQRFSTEACRSKFPVGVATPAIMQAYGVKLPIANMTGRTSFVIAPNGRIVFVHNDMNYIDHVRTTLAAVQSLRR